MDKEADPLTALISSDAKSTDRKKLAELLAPYLAIDHDSRDFGFTPKFDDVGSNNVKVELLLAGAKARALLFNQADGLTPSEIIAVGVMAEGSVKTSLKRLFDSRKDGRYYLPPHRIPELTKRAIDQ
jgi:hypothetical protein